MSNPFHHPSSHRLHAVREQSGKTFRTIGEVASMVEVSPQTLRVWEAQELVIPQRSAGGQRLYSEADVERAQQVAELRRRNGWNPAAIRTALAGGRRTSDGGQGKSVERWDGAAIRRARRDRDLTVREAAKRIGISPSFLSSIERGETGVSTQIISRIADAFLTPMSGLARFQAHHPSVVRSDERARGEFRGDVIWEELTLPGHAMEPALLTVPPGEDSGGAYARPGETFAFVLSGTLLFTVDGKELRLEDGDSIILAERSEFAWSNPGKGPAMAFWVEQIVPQAWSAAATQRVVEEVRSSSADEPG